jgi:2-polyprenyl-6-methoxyphenol hydroxylase-like FAD-dependent oxidoreductase
VVTNARVAVIGGSLGGLTVALLLRELGLDVTVYERSGAELEQRGAGIGFLPASSRYLVERAEDVRKMDDAGVDEIFFDVAFQKDAQSGDGLLRYLERFRRLNVSG